MASTLRYKDDRSQLHTLRCLLFLLLAGPHPHSLSLGDYAPRSGPVFALLRRGLVGAFGVGGRRRFPLSLVPCPLYDVGYERLRESAASAEPEGTGPDAGGD